MKLRSIELALPHAGEAAAFLTDIWGMAPAAVELLCHTILASAQVLSSATRSPSMTLDLSGIW